MWEISIKSLLGKLRLEVAEVDAAELEGGIVWLPFSAAHAIAVARLPDHHRDPFDRALIAQAQCEPLYLLTRDSPMGAYGATVLLV